MSSSTAAPKLNPERIFTTLFAYQQTFALKAAVELDLFTAIGEGADDPALLAKRCQASERGVRMLADYMTVQGFLRKENGKYQLTQESTVFLDRRSPACMGSMANFLADDTNVAHFSRLAEAVRKGGTASNAGDNSKPLNDRWVGFAKSMGPMAVPMAGVLTQMVKSSGERPIRVLDIAAGHGLFGIAVARRDPGAEIVVDRLRERRLRVIAYALTDTSPGRGGYLRGVSERFETAAGPATALLGRIVAADPDGTTIEIYGLDELAGALTVRLATAGRHNTANALAVAGAAKALGLDPAAITAGLAGFGGVGRRLERKGEIGGVVVYDDYGHHPTAIRETLAAVRQREPGRRVWAVYEPLTYHRTAAMLDAFADALADADAVAIADIWAGRDPDTTITSAAALADAVAARRPALPVFAPGDVEATAAALAEHVRAGDAVLVMGGGQSYRIAELLLARLEVS
jgi:hypothetical protein